MYPSRNGRHSHVYTNHGKLNLLNSKYELDPRPIEEGCGCPACRSYSRAYIRHLFKAKEMLGMRLCVLHNLYFYNKMMEEIRDAIEHHCYAEYKANETCRHDGGIELKEENIPHEQHKRNDAFTLYLSLPSSILWQSVHSPRKRKNRQN